MILKKPTAADVVSDRSGVTKVLMILKKPTAADVVSDRSGVTISQTVNMADSSNFHV